MTALDAGAPEAAGLSRGFVIGAAVLLALAATPLAAEAYGGDYLISLVARAMILAIAAISLDLLVGHGGMVSFGHSAFMAIGAYAAGIMVEEGVEGVLPIIAVALAASTAFALFSGAVSLRTSGVYFIMITLAFAQMVFFALGSLSRYGADDGLTLWSAIDVFGTGLLDDDLGVFFAVLAVLAAVWLLVDALAGSRFGRVLRAARQNPVRVATMGYSVFAYRLTAYVIAGGIAALAGVLLASQASFVSPAIGAWQRSGDLLAIVVLGGLGTRNGAMLGALFFVLIEETLSSITHDWRLIFGPMLVLLALHARGGLSGLLDRVGR